MNTLRHRSALLAVAGAALVLPLTACQSDGGTKSAPADSSSASASTSAQASNGKGTGSSDSAASTDSSGKAVSAGSKGSTGSKGSSGSSGSAGASGQQASGSTPACTSKDVKITAATQDGPPYTHIVLTAKNTSGHTCQLNGFPHIQFLESHKQDVTSVAKSKPAVPVVLAAGDPAFVLVKLSDGGRKENVEPVSAFSVQLEGDPTVIVVKSPGAEGIAVDGDKALTGYWTTELRNGADDF